MAESRKVFRIEKTAAARLEPSIEGSQSGLRHGEIMRELAALRAALAGLSPQNSRAAADTERVHTARLASELNLIADAIRGEAEDNDSAAPNRNAGASRSAVMPLARTEHELAAVVDGTERATQRILSAAEQIDVAAGNLSASLDGRIEQDLAQDIQDLVIQIFEACNFQDLVGQRVAKVIAALSFVESHIAHVLDEIKNPTATTRGDGQQTLHGPRLDTDRGHATQHDIDAMFISRR